MSETTTVLYHCGWCGSVTGLRFDAKIRPTRAFAPLAVECSACGAWVSICEVDLAHPVASATPEEWCDRNGEPPRLSIHGEPFGKNGEPLPRRKVGKRLTADDVVANAPSLRGDQTDEQLLRTLGIEPGARQH